MQTKRIVVLANSRKHSERCVAGKEILPNGYGGWIRPVSARHGHGIDDRDSTYADGNALQVLDVVDVPLVGPRPYACHTENCLISDPDYWVKVGAFDWGQARALAENPPTLWTNGDSTRAGMNDQIEISKAKAFESSICLVHVSAVELHVLDPGAEYGKPKRRVQARFTFNGIVYWLWTQDLVIEKQHLTYAVGTVTRLGESLIAVSLAEATEKRPGEYYHYKLAAAILAR